MVTDGRRDRDLRRRTGVDPRRVEQLWRREDERFRELHPRCAALSGAAERSMPRGVPMSWMTDSFDHPPVWVESGHGAHFTCADGVRFLDTNIGDKSTFCGLDPEPVVRAVQRRLADGWQFMQPLEDAIPVAEELARRWRRPFWQFTLSATQANVEAVRLARLATGRDKVLLFFGNYAGHADELLVSYSGGELRSHTLGLASRAFGAAGIVPFNDLDALTAALASGEHACVLTEPALTNVGVVLPDPGFHEELRRLTRETGTLLVLDETHTLICGPAGLVGRWGLEPDIVTMGKAIGGGVPLGAYGMTEELADVHLRERGPDGSPGELATGGTLFANGLSMAAARAALTEVLTEEAYGRTVALGARLADGLESLFGDAGLDWPVHRLYARSGWSLGGRLPRNAAEADHDAWPELSALQHTYLADRGVWEAISSAGPAVSVAASAADVDDYLAVVGDLVAELTA
jgi:glutamate-1-semialdehyde 2,1-aminomutase